MVNFGPLAAEIGLPVLGTPANFNGFRVLTVLLHASQVVSVSQTLRRWTEGATYVRQGDHHVGHWPTFLVWVRMRTPGNILICSMMRHRSTNRDTIKIPYSYLWPPCGIGQAIIFLPCGFFFYILSSFFRQNLSGRRLDVYHISTHDVTLVRI